MATIYEVSTLAGVSLATVSRVMNGTAKVSPRTEQKVKNAMHALGYMPNSVAISLASKRSNCVGILVAEFESGFFGGLMRGVEGELRKYRKHLVMTAGHGNMEDEIEGIEFLKSHNCDALIIHAEMLSDEYLIELSKGKTPVYILNRNIPQLQKQCMSIDNVYGSYVAAKHVLDKGHTKIVNISGPPYKIDSQLRIEGFNKALNEYGLSIPLEHIYEGDYLQESGAAAVEYFMEKNVQFTAIVCGNDQMAIGAMAKLREYGKVPAQDVAIIGFDDVSFAEYTFPRLTTVKYPIEEMGKASANSILKEVYKIDMPCITKTFEPSLVVRDSVLQKT
jgi:LacI family transcriptional regulator